jgi:beta-lactamase superfamily II metal-dependent hydrolase
MIIEALNASNGDAAIVRHKGIQGYPVNGLIDGGPTSALERSIEPALTTHGISDQAGVLDWVAVSHIDSDHIGGVLGLVRAGYMVDRFFYNTPTPFPEQAAAPATGNPVRSDRETRLGQMLNAVPPGVRAASYPQGQELLDLVIVRGAHLLNPPHNQRLLTGDTCEIDGLTLSIVAPSQPRIDALLAQWALVVAGPATASAEKMDTSITNLSSLAFLISDGGRTALFTGDSLEDDIVAGLEALGHALPMHVDVLKVPHHGSNSAADPDALTAGRGLIENVTADYYIVSADGTSTNPSESTLQRIVDIQNSQCTILLPSPRIDGGSSRRRHYAAALDALEKMRSQSPARIEVVIGIGEPLVIDLS